MFNEISCMSDIVIPSGPRQPTTRTTMESHKGGKHTTARGTIAQYKYKYRYRYKYKYKYKYKSTKVQVQVPSWGHLGPILGPSWAFLWPSWGHLGAILGHLGAVLGPSLAILGSAWAHLGACEPHKRQDAKT